MYVCYNNNYYNYFTDIIMCVCALQLTLQVLQKVNNSSYKKHSFKIKKKLENIIENIFKLINYNFFLFQLYFLKIIICKLSL